MSVNTTQLLAETPLFSTMDEEERRQLRAIMRERSFQPGQVVMAASDPEASFLIIEQGEMEVWLTDTDGKKVVLEVLGPGKVFGDLFMLAGKTRSASATTSGELVTVMATLDIRSDNRHRKGSVRTQTTSWQSGHTSVILIL
jgi:CRP-like cAMP-binding protein